MQSFCAPEVEAQLILDMLAAKEHVGPKCPTGAWQDMSLKQQEYYFVYLRLAVEYSSRHPEDVSEAAMQYLFSLYEEVFTHLVNVDSKLRKAVLNKSHRFLMENDPDIVSYFSGLVRREI